MTAEKTEEVSTLLSLASDPSLIGRELEVAEANTVMRGPITHIEVVNGTNIMITVGWRAIKRTGAWTMYDPKPHIYGGRDGWANAFEKRDGSIEIDVQMTWSGAILPASTPRLVLSPN